MRRALALMAAAALKLAIQVRIAVPLRVTLLRVTRGVLLRVMVRVLQKQPVAAVHPSCKRRIIVASVHTILGTIRRKNIAARSCEALQQDAVHPSCKRGKIAKLVHTILGTIGRENIAARP